MAKTPAKAFYMPVRLVNDLEATGLSKAGVMAMLLEDIESGRADLPKKASGERTRLMARVDPKYVARVAKHVEARGWKLSDAFSEAARQYLERYRAMSPAEQRAVRKANAAMPSQRGRKTD